MTVVALIRRLRDEFTALPGLRLNEAQVQRLYDVRASTAASALRLLASAGFLRALEDGGYRRVDMPGDVDVLSASDTGEPPWRRILCLVEFDDGNHHSSLTAASHSALTYATSLGVLHRARVTALYLIPSLPSGPTEQHAFLERLVEDVFRQTRRQSIPGLIDVHVATGASNEGLLRSAREMRADLIVLGRRESGAPGLSQLRDTLRDAPCHVLVVHPSGQAAVA